MTGRRRWPLVVAIAALAAVGVVVVASGGGQRSAVGVVVDVDAVGLTQVRGFTLRGPDGRQTTFELGRLENAAEFPPAHLAEHIATAQPVRVFYRDESGRRVVYRVEDAPGG